MSSRLEASRDGPADQGNEVHLEIRERNRDKGENKYEKDGSCQKLSSSIELCLIVARGWMSEPEEEDQEEGKEPGRKEKEAENTEPNRSHGENEPASSAKDRVSNVAPIELPYGHQVEGCNEEAHPARKCQRMKDNVCSLWDLADDSPLKE